MSNQSISNCAFDMPTRNTPEDGTYGLIPGTTYLPQIKSRTQKCPRGRPNCPPTYSVSYSQTKGYLVEFTAPGKMNIYMVTNEFDQPTSTSYNYTNALTRTLVDENVDFPQNGLIFAEDNVWVAAKPGVKIQGRLTIAAARLGTSDNAKIVIASPLEYADKDGTDVLGLVGEGDVEYAPYAPPNSGSFTFRIHAAVLSEAGGVTARARYVNMSSWAIDTRTKGWTQPNQLLEFYGSVGVRNEWTWNWYMSAYCTPYNTRSWDNQYSGPRCSSAGDSYYSGIERNTTQYDQNLRYAPPPHYPITSGMDILSWREIVTQP